MRRWAAAWVVAASLQGALPVLAQTPPSPSAVADELLRSFESMAWRAGAQRLHPEALGIFHESVNILVRTDATGQVLARLLDGASAEAYPDLPAEEVFHRVMTALMTETPGLANALVTRRHEIIGEVAEGSGTTHVVYRVRTTLSGEEPVVKVMTLGRTDGGWKVLRVDELDAVRTALRGIPMGGPAPPARVDTMSAGGRPGSRRPGP